MPLHWCDEIIFILPVRTNIGSISIQDVRAVLVQKSIRADVLRITLRQCIEESEHFSLGCYPFFWRRFEICGYRWNLCIGDRSIDAIFYESIHLIYGVMCR